MNGLKYTNRLNVIHSMKYFLINNNKLSLGLSIVNVLDNGNLNSIKNKKENRVLRKLYSQDFTKPRQILEKLL
jgi:hypothetical protein